MKRSEALKIVLLALKDTGLHYYDNGDFDDPDEAEAEIILQALDNAGFKPPSYRNPKYKDISVLEHADLSAQAHLYTKRGGIDPYELEGYDPEENV